jgi:hypothetical protein
VCPKLQVHGLAINEKVAGVRYRRYAVTPLGSAFLADMEKRIVLNKERQKRAVKEGATNAKADQSSPATPAKDKRAKDK